MSADLIASSVPLQRPTVSTPDLGPGRHGVDAHLVGVGAEILRRREGGGDVVAPRAEIAQQHDGLALLHVAELEFLAEQHRELGVVQRFVHAAYSVSEPSREVLAFGKQVSKGGGRPHRTSVEGPATYAAHAQDA